MLSFIVPAFNEGKNIEATVTSTRDIAAESGLIAYEIIVVDDGSLDDTAAKIELLKKAVPELISISHPTNLGLGSAIRSGLNAARYPQFMVLPGDNDIHPDMVRLMIAFRDRAEMITTVPLNKEIRSFGRNTMSMLYQLIHLLVFNAFLNYINGPGIWPTQKARAVGLRGRRFSIISELNMKLLRTGCTFAEVPGYMQMGAMGRRTVTVRNMIEVVRAFLGLAYEIHVSSRERFSKRPQRVLIDFSPELAPRPNTN
jgi:glycosyltransferase involved in cell wall biosynthesis